MPPCDRRHPLLLALVRAWAGTGPDRAWTPEEVQDVWPAVRAHHLEAALGPLLPPELLTDAQRDQIAACRHRSQFLLMELERILPAVRAAGGAPVLLKGAALALAAYEDPGTRWFVDLDLLVPRDRVEPVCAALEGTGYRPLRDRADWAYYDRHHLHRILVGPSGAVVEVHWALTLPESAYRSDDAGLRRRARTATVGREACLVAAPADQVLHAVYQHIADGFVDLRRVLDLHLLGRQLTPADWRDVARLARETRLEPGLAYWLHIMKSIVGAVPPGAPALRGPAPLAWRLLENLDVAGGCLDRRSERVPGYEQFVHLVLLPSTSLRIRDLGRALWPRQAPGGLHGQPGDRAVRGWRRLRLGLWNARNLARVGLGALGALRP